MHTLSMDDIAKLARVQRPVVSVWRTRYPASDAYPFPAPVSDVPLRFDAGAVTAWLEQTGRGNNPAASADAAILTDPFDRIVADPGHASALLLVHALTGGPVTGATIAHALDAVEARDLSWVLPRATIASAMRDVALCGAVDAVSDAAYSAARALERLLEAQFTRSGAWASEALTAPGRDLFGDVLVNVWRTAPGPIVPFGPGGMTLVSASTTRFDEHERAPLIRPDEDPPTVADLVAWRTVAALEFPTHAAAKSATSDAPPRLLVGMVSDAPTAEACCTAVEQLLLDRGPRDRVLVVGPAKWLTDRDGRAARINLLAPDQAHTEPLRFVARLPRGFSRFGGRRRMALWLFGTPRDSTTVVANHDDHDGSAAVASALSSDAAASLSEGDALVTHAFRASTSFETKQLVRRPQLISAATLAPAPVDGRDRLAKIWATLDHLDRTPASPALLQASTPAADTPRPTAPVVLGDAVPRLASDRAGTRLVVEHIVAAGPNVVPVIGADEVRRPEHIGRRGIDRLTLARVAPNVRLTMPHDVVYVPSGGPAAIVDHLGGHVVLAPARVLRCHDRPSTTHRLVPAIVAADINRQTGSDRRTWPLRTVPRRSGAPLVAAAADIALRRDRLRHELRLLDELERELVDGLADGSLSLLPSDPAPDSRRKASA